MELKNLFVLNGSKKVSKNQPNKYFLAYHLNSKLTFEAVSEERCDVRREVRYVPAVSSAVYW